MLVFERKQEVWSCKQSTLREWDTFRWHVYGQGCLESPVLDKYIYESLFTCRPTSYPEDTILFELSRAAKHMPDGCLTSVHW